MPGTECQVVLRLVCPYTAPEPVLHERRAFCLPRVPASSRALSPQPRTWLPGPARDSPASGRMRVPPARRPISTSTAESLLDEISTRVRRAMSFGLTVIPDLVRGSRHRQWRTGGKPVRSRPAGEEPRPPQLVDPEAAAPRRAFHRRAGKRPFSQILYERPRRRTYRACCASRASPSHARCARFSRGHPLLLLPPAPTSPEGMSRPGGFLPRHSHPQAG